MKKQEKHKKVLSFLDSYLKETPKEVILSELREVSELKFAGTSAKDYFLNFHKYYNKAEKTPQKRLKSYKKKSKTAVMLLPKFEKSKTWINYFKPLSSIEVDSIPCQLSAWSKIKNISHRESFPKFNSINTSEKFNNLKKTNRYNYV